MRRAQTATEYLIILAVVIIIALIVVGVMGGIPGIGGAAQARASASYWATQDIAISSYGDSATTGITLTVKNNKRNAVTVTDVVVDGTSIDTSPTGVGVPVTLGPGGTGVVTDTGITCTAGQAFSYPVVIKYTEGGLSYTFTGATPLDGTCAT